MVWLPRRETIFATGSDNWPEPCHQTRRIYFLELSSGPTNDTPKPTKEMTLRALEMVKHRTDIEHLSFKLSMLFDRDFRKSIGDLLNLNDRSWSIEFLCAKGVIRGMNRRRLRLSLSVFQKVEYMDAIFEGANVDTLKLLRNMPDFERLKQFNMMLYPSVENDCLEALMGLPFAPLITGIGLDNIRLEQPIFSMSVSRHIRAYTLGFPHESPPTTIALIEALSALPALQRLDVVFYDFGEIIETRLLHILCEWLKSPQCNLTAFRLNWSYDFTPMEPPLTFADLPSSPKLKELTVTGYNVESFNTEALLQFMKDSPCLESVLLEVSYLDKDTARKLLECQLQCRPRLLSIKVGPEVRVEDDYVDVENFHQIERLYGCIRDYKQSSTQALPVSVWPMVLEKLGNIIRCPTDAIHEIGIEAIFHALPKLFCDPDWMHGKKRRRIV